MQSDPAWLDAKGERPIAQQVQALADKDKKAFVELCSKWRSKSRDLPQSDYDILRVLRASRGKEGFDVKAAKKVLSNYVKWSVSIGLHEMSIQTVRAQLETCTLFVPGVFTKDSGLPVMFMKPSLYFPKQTALNDLMRATVYYLQRMTDLEKTCVDGIAFVADMQEWTFTNFTVRYAKTWFDTMQGRFPVRVQLFLIVDPPPWFGTIWKIIRPMMSSAFAKKVHLCSKVQAAEFFASKNDMPVAMGGKVVPRQVIDSFVKHRYEVEKLNYHAAYGYRNDMADEEAKEQQFDIMNSFDTDDDTSSSAAPVQGKGSRPGSGMQTPVTSHRSSSALSQAVASASNTSPSTQQKLARSNSHLQSPHSTGGSAAGAAKADYDAKFHHVEQQNEALKAEVESLRALVLMQMGKSNSPQPSPTPPMRNSGRRGGGRSEGSPRMDSPNSDTVPLQAQSRKETTPANFFAHTHSLGVPAQQATQYRLGEPQLQSTKSLPAVAQRTSDINMRMPDYHLAPSTFVYVPPSPTNVPSEAHQTPSGQHGGSFDAEDFFEAGPGMSTPVWSLATVDSGIIAELGTNTNIWGEGASKVGGTPAVQKVRTIKPPERPMRKHKLPQAHVNQVFG